MKMELRKLMSTPRIHRFFLLPMFTLLFWAINTGAGHTASTAVSLTLEGRILDGTGQPVSGAEVLVYTTPNVRQPAGYISAKSGADGRYSMALPPGRYWAVAMERKSGEKVGPLALGDKYSGEPTAFEINEHNGKRLDFTVLALREAARQHLRKNENTVRISGRILDRKGKPVPMAYAMADRNQAVNGIPEFISSWTDQEGRYDLFLPRGEYHIGAARHFPPAPAMALTRMINCANNPAEIDLIVPDQ